MTEDAYKRQLQRMLLQQHVGEEGDGSIVSRSSSKVMTRRRSQEIGGTVVRALDDPDYMVRAKRRESLVVGGAGWVIVL